MQISKIFKLPIYHTVIDIRIVKSVRETANKIYKKHGFNENDQREYRGLSFNFDIDRFYLLFDITLITHGLLAHEIDHLVTDLLIVNNITDAEARGFLVELLHTQVYRFIKEKNLEIA